MEFIESLDSEKCYLCIKDWIDSNSHTKKAIGLMIGTATLCQFELLFGCNNTKE